MRKTTSKTEHNPIMIGWTIHDHTARQTWRTVLFQYELIFREPAFIAIFSQPNYSGINHSGVVVMRAIKRGQFCE